MDNTIDIKKLLEQSRNDAETMYKEGAATLVSAGIFMATGVPEAFGLTKENMFDFAKIIYDTALSKCGFGAGDPGEDAI